MVELATERKYSPMLTEYLGFKERCQDCLLLYQVGDFYEVFFEDAITVSSSLNLTLTSRDKSNPDAVPMCGVPVGVVDNYLERLVDGGFSVAVVSQCEIGKVGSERVSRKLDRVITPGIRLLSTVEKDSGESKVGSINILEDEVSLAYSDVQSGKLFVKENIALADLVGEVEKIGISEIILPQVANGERLDKRVGWVRQIGKVLKESSIKFRSESSAFSEPHAGERYKFLLSPGYLRLGSSGRRSSKLLASYIEETIVEGNLSVSEVIPATGDEFVAIDSNTRRNLELVRNLSDRGKEGTLFELLDCTLTVGGSRVLRDWIVNPLKDLQRIKLRADAVQALIEVAGSRTELRGTLRFMADLERLAARVELQVVTPKELGALRDSLTNLPVIKQILQKNVSAATLKSERLSHILENLPELGELLSMLASSLTDDPPYSLNYGGIMRHGINLELDKLREIKNAGKSWLTEFERDERESTGIGSLKVKFNNVFGFFIEVTKPNLARVPAHYFRKQTTVGGERFTTPELKEREAQVLGAEAKEIELERRLFDELRREVAKFNAALRFSAALISELDVLCALADVSDREGYVRPELENSQALLITAGKHPVLAKMLAGSFIPNSLLLESNSKSCVIVTGPNMGGKSTYLRQAALIVILSQIGCFVPAKAARIGLVDAIFARIGASDNLLEGQSTFMVEMKEAANILLNATSSSLLLIDEIGRGTSTTDGLAIAQAILEWIVTIKCRTLFATHFHELTALADKHEIVQNLSVGSQDSLAGVIFTHEIHAGPASKSYGIEVARLAGLPEEVLTRARILLARREALASNKNDLANAQLSLFSKSTKEESVEFKKLEPLDYKALKRLEQQLSEIKVNEITPLMALNLLEGLHKEALNHNKAPSKGES